MQGGGVEGGVCRGVEGGVWKVGVWRVEFGGWGVEGGVGVCRCGGWGVEGGGVQGGGVLMQHREGFIEPDASIPLSPCIAL